MKPSLHFWIGLACISVAPSHILSITSPLSFPQFLAFIVLGIVLITWGVRGLGRLECGNWRCVGLSMSCLVCVVSLCANGFAAYLAVREIDVPWLSQVAEVVLHNVAHTRSTADGLLAIDAYEGALTFRPTLQSCGFVPLFSFFVVAAVGELLCGYSFKRVLVCALCVVLTATLKWLVSIGLFLGIDYPLSSTIPDHRGLFQDQWVTFAWLAVLALVLHSLAKPIGKCPAWFRKTTSQQDRRTIVQLACVLAVCVLGVTYGVSSYSNGERKEGRVLIDDVFCKDWGPASRLVNEEWYGDFSTYNLGSIVEYLGYFYSCAVNVERKYTRELLSQYDILVLRTPTIDIPPDQEKEILAFVENGGGLLLIGDHTNLMSTSSRLNRLARHAGIQFNSDSVMDGLTGYFTTYKRGVLFQHPATSRVNAVEFMTSCSLAIDFRAIALMEAPHQSRQEADYSQSSYFGKLHSDPSVEYGAVVLAALGRCGKGVVIAFTDSTVLSSFGVFSHDREKMMLGCVNVLNRRPDVLHLAVRCVLCAIAGLSVLVFGGVLVRRAGLLSTYVAVPFCSGVIGGLAVAGAFSAFASDPQPHTPLPTIAVYTDNMEGYIPPVLGGTGNLDLDWCYDTLLSAIPRVGVFPSPSKSLRECLREKGILLINPKALEPDGTRDLYSWVANGGRLLIAVRSDHYHLEAINSYLAPFGEEVTDSIIHGNLDLPECERKQHCVDMRSYTKKCGKGTVTVVIGSEWWSRKRLGHPFDLPTARQREHYRVLYEILDSELGLGPASREMYDILVVN